MIQWAERSHEERALLNPGFCAQLLWCAANSCVRDLGGLSFEEAFLVLPFVLHRGTRETLPKTTKTSLAVWLDANPLARGRSASRARLLISTTKEAMIFGDRYGLIQVNTGHIQAVEGWKLPIDRALQASSDEVRECMKRAKFIGRWFALAGSTTTVMALLGVRP